MYAPGYQALTLYTTLLLLFPSSHQIHLDPPRLVVKAIQKEDQGMYQCLVTNDWEQIQSTGELQLGGMYQKKKKSFN